jgi:hypothetical protein
MRSNAFTGIRHHSHSHTHHTLNPSCRRIRATVKQIERYAENKADVEEGFENMRLHVTAMTEEFKNDPAALARIEQAAVLLTDIEVPTFMVHKIIS